MKYLRLAKEAKRAYDIGINYVINNMIPSIWCEGGLGWQEIWKTAPYAGLYASCMGIELISGCFTKEIEDIKNNVYKNVVCAMNIDVETKDLREKEMREKNINITLKAVKFLAATSCMNEEQINNKVVKQCIKQIENAMLEDGSFLPAINSYDESILTTYEVIINLKDYLKKDEKKFNATLKYFEDIIYQNITINSEIDLKDRALIALSIIFKFSEYYSKEVIDKAITIFYSLKKNWGNELRIENRFHVPGCNYIQDIYSISKPLLILDLTIDLINRDLVSYHCINEHIPYINDVIEKIIEQGFYSNTKKDISFGINYHALMGLQKIYNLICLNEKFREEDFMVINPTLFREQDFSIEPNLVVVLMPFKPNWSKAVFNAFKEAAESKGLIVWRSDIEYKDDQIVQTIWNKINQAKFVIADCTGKNPNVFYELGIAHTIGKSVFLCSQKIKDYPFDISGIRHFDYETHDFPGLKNNLIKFIEEKFGI